MAVTAMGPGVSLRRRWSLPHSCGARHLPLLLVIQGEAKRIAKGHQRPFHRIGFGLLDG